MAKILLQKMKKNPEKSTIRQKIGSWLETAGLALFLLTFWANIGFELGGDSTILGPKFRELEVIFPLAGCGIFAVFFGKIISKTTNSISREFALFSLFFIAIFVASALFSRDPNSAILPLIIWTTGLLAFACSNTFLVQRPLRRTLFLLGIIAGVATSKFFPNAIPEPVSDDLLGIAAMLGVVFLMREPVFSGRKIWMIFYAWVVAESGNFPLVIFALIFWLGIKFWRPPARKKSEIRQILQPIIFLVIFSVWNWFGGTFSSSPTLFSPTIPYFFSSISDTFFGVGQTQFLVALQQSASTILTPDLLRLPGSGFLHTFFETGLFGVIFIVALLFFPKFHASRAPIFPAIFLAGIWIFSNQFFSTETGILFAVFALATLQNPTEIR